MVERVKNTKNDKALENEASEPKTEKQRERILADLEKAEIEHRQKTSQEQVLAEAKNLAKEADEEKATQEHPEHIEHLRHAPSKKQRADSFKSQMTEIRNEMSLANRVMSKIMHNVAVERISDVAASTVARPNAMLSGSIAAFISITVLYFVARYYGYHLSGFETVFAFTFGWIAGILYDYFKALTNNRNK